MKMGAAHKPAGEDTARAAISDWAQAARIALQSGSWWHSVDLGDGHITPGVHPIDELREKYASLSLPEDLTGKRLLDVGCWDGFYSFEAERHGAEVVAVDYCSRPEAWERGHLARKSLNLRCYGRPRWPRSQASQS